MQRLIVIFFFSACVLLGAHAKPLTTAQIAQLAKSRSIASVSSIATSNGYKLGYKRNGAVGYEDYDVTDMG